MSEGVVRLRNAAADLYVPDGTEERAALSRTTHLCIGAHPDDIEIMAYHGIAACFGRADQWMCGVIVTDGAGSSRTGRYARMTDDEMREVRRREQRKAALVGEYGAQVQLAYTGAEAKASERSAIVEDLLGILEIARPRIVYLHNPADKHDTHVATLLCSLEALRGLPADNRPDEVYGCEIWRSLDWLPDSDKVILPVSASPNLAAALIGVFDSQISGGKRYDLATAGRRYANATYLQAHAPDEETAVTYAMNLRPLLENPALTLQAFTFSFLERFREDIRDRLSRFT
jgi:LmbE family N-acetylglucosaminyl deacetylase